MDRDFLEPQPRLSWASVMITGGTGSFGQAMVRKILPMRDGPRRVIIFSRDEQKQYEFRQKLLKEHAPNITNRLRFFVGDVRDYDRLMMAMQKVDLVIHAAAMKIVPVAEFNPFECVKTNIHGAENIVRAAIRCRVSKVMSLSTDKAVNPINLYGATKLAAEKIFTAANHLSVERETIFSSVRYGNVIGSRGSVVPHFQAVKEEDADYVPITDERMTRFWLSMDQGLNFVLSSIAKMRGGEIFVPKIPSMKVTDLAEQICPGKPHVFIGIRPGEKLHETLVAEDEARNTEDDGDRYVIQPPGVTAVNPIEERYGSDNNSEWLTHIKL